MGWSDCGTDHEGRPIGYAHEATCDWPGCDEQIDRGLSYVCGDMHLSGESCNGYFCAEHRTFSIRALRGQRCHLCYAWDLLVHWCDQCEGECRWPDLQEGSAP
jgi:hypothetical protein